MGNASPTGSILGVEGEKVGSQAFCNGLMNKR